VNNKGSVLLVDDHPLFRRGLRDVIAGKTNYKVVAEAENGATAITLSRIHQPELTIIDLALPDYNGLQLMSVLKRSGSKSLFVVMTLYNDITLIDEALKLGACAYLMKTDGLDVVEDCIDSVAVREVFVSPSVSIPPPNKPAANSDSEDLKKTLSNREKLVLQGIANNRTSREIAESMTLSTRTVQNHRARIIRKLGLQGANALYRFALENATQYQHL